jgi:predicted ester cyclase
MKKYILLVLVLAFATIAAVCAPAATSAPTPPPPTAAPARFEPTPAESTEANKALVRRYYDQFVQAGNLNALDDFVTPNYKRYLSPTAAPINAAAQKQRMAGLRAVSSDFKLTIDHLIAEGDLVAIGSTYRGTYTGAFMGIPPSGKQGTFASFEIIRIENGKIAEHWGGPDMMDMVLQAGGAVSAAPPK